MFIAELCFIVRLRVFVFMYVCLHYPFSPVVYTRIHSFFLNFFFFADFISFLCIHFRFYNVLLLLEYKFNCVYEHECVCECVCVCVYCFIIYAYLMFKCMQACVRVYECECICITLYDMHIPLETFFCFSEK